MQEQSSIAAGPVELHDLAEPTFSAEAQEMLGMIASVVDQCPLDSEAIHRQAAADLGLDDFGPRDYLERTRPAARRLPRPSRAHADRPGQLSSSRWCSC